MNAEKSIYCRKSSMGINADFGQTDMNELNFNESR